jgi:hypothetical protein
MPIFMPMSRSMPTRRHSALSLLGALLCTAAAAEPKLTCQVTYAGATQTVLAQPVADPYSVPSVDISGRFRFKAVMVGHASQVDRILLYTYLDADPHPVLLHQAKYLPPYPQSAQPWPITGQQHVYGGQQERELIYSCTLEGLAP